MYVPYNTSFQIMSLQAPINFFPFFFSFLSLHTFISLPPTSFQNAPPS